MSLLRSIRIPIWIKSILGDIGDPEIKQHRKFKIDIGILLLLVWRILVVNILSFLISPLPMWLKNSVDALGYIGILLMILYASDRLNEFHIDRGAFLLILLGSLINVVMSNDMMKLLIFSPCLLLAAFTMFQYVKGVKAFTFAPGKGPTTLLIGAISGFLISLVSLFVIMLLYSDLSSLNSLKFNVGAFFYRFTYEIEYSAALEEPLFRGFVMGYLYSKGIKSSYVIMIQGFLFWIAHINAFDSWIFIFVILPLASLLYGLLVSRSKTLLPSMISHAVFNSFKTLVF